MVTGLDVDDVFTYCFDHPRGFMAKYSRHGSGVFTLYEMQVAVAQAANTGPYQHLVALGFYDLEVLNGHGLTWAMKYGGFQFIFSCGMCLGFWEMLRARVFFCCGLSGAGGLSFRRNIDTIYSQWLRLGVASQTTVTN